MASSPLSRLIVAHRLGFGNVARVLSYRIGLKFRISSATRIAAALPTGTFFEPPSRPPIPSAPPSAWVEHALYFGWWRMPLTEEPPDWHSNPLNGVRSNERSVWYEIPDFDARIGDIKTVWEASRWDWVVALASAAVSATNQRAPQATARLNRWLSDWCDRNPAYLGANWMNGQEAAIRVMHLAAAALILGQTAAPRPELCALLEAHLARIRSTLNYAIGQANNHGTSEAAALYIGGSWLHQTTTSAYAEGWANAGREWLERLVDRLVFTDGTFSQYSTNYHRLLLDTLSMVEIWRRHLGLRTFSERYGKKCRAASEWLRHFVQPLSGRVPNMGANDSARLIPVADTDLTDFRPSVHLAGVLFRDAVTFPEHEPSHRVLELLGLGEPKAALPTAGSCLYADGGFAVLRKGRAAAYLRFPRFRYRPSQADALHLDLWVDGENWLRDAGSYSYAAPPPETSYFSGTASHNTVHFDERDQMPRLGRFLFGDWLTTETCSQIEETDDGLEFSASYKDREGCRHHRRIRLSSSSLSVTDTISGFRNTAVLRWRLRPGGWRITRSRVIGERFSLETLSDVPLASARLVDGWESRYYFRKEQLPVFEVEVRQPAVLETRIEWT